MRQSEWARERWSEDPTPPGCETNGPVVQHFHGNVTINMVGGAWVRQAMRKCPQCKTRTPAWWETCRECGRQFGGPSTHEQNAKREKRR